MSEKPNELATENERLKSLVSSMKDQSQTLSESNEGLNKQVVELAAKSRKLQSNNESLTAEVSKLKAEINSSASGHKPSFRSADGSREKGDADLSSSENGFSDGKADIAVSPSHGANKSKGATKSGDVGSEMGFAVSNPTSSSEATGLMAGTDAATLTADDANGGGGIRGKNNESYGYAALIMTFLASIYAWVIGRKESKDND